MQDANLTAQEQEELRAYLETLAPPELRQFMLDKLQGLLYELEQAVQEAQQRNNRFAPVLEEAVVGLPMSSFDHLCSGCAVRWVLWCLVWLAFR